MVFGVFIGSFLFVFSLVRNVLLAAIGAAGLTLALCATAQIVLMRFETILQRREGATQPIRPFRSNGLPGSSEIEDDPQLK